MMRRRAIMPAAALIVAACTGAGTASPSPKPDITDPPVRATEPPIATDATGRATASPAGPTGSPGAAPPTECVSAPYDIQVDLTGDGESTTFRVVDAEDGGAGERSDGVFKYVIYLTDFDIADTKNVIDQVLFPPQGATVFTLEVRRVTDPDDPTPSSQYPIIRAGEQLLLLSKALGPDQLAARLTVAGPDLGTPAEPAPEAVTGTILHAEGGIVCVDLAITSREGYSIEGIITARVRPNLMLGN